MADYDLEQLVIIRTARPELGIITAAIDAVTDIKYQFGTSIGQEPIEQGLETQDHATALPISMIVTCQVGTLAGAQRPREAMKTLEKMHLDKEVFRAMTEDTTFEECIIRRFDANRKGNIRGLLLQLELLSLNRVGVGRDLVSAASVSGPAAHRTVEVERGNILPVDAVSSVMNSFQKDLGLLGISSSTAAINAANLSKLADQKSGLGDNLMNGISYINRASNFLDRSVKRVTDSGIVQTAAGIGQSVSNIVRSIRPEIGRIRGTVGRIENTLGRLLNIEDTSDDIVSGLNQVSSNIERANLAASRIASVGRSYP